MDFAHSIPIMQIPISPMSVMWNDYINSYCMITADNSEIFLRTASTLSGPWAEPVPAFTLTGELRGELHSLSFHSMLSSDKVMIATFSLIDLDSLPYMLEISLSKPESKLKVD
jgi:hypothetical protein